MALPDRHPWTAVGAMDMLRLRWDRPVVLSVVRVVHGVGRVDISSAER